MQWIEAKKGKILWLEGIIEAINDGVLVIDQSGIVQLINEEYSNITGVSADEIIGKPLVDVRPGARLPSVLKSGKSCSGIVRKEASNEYVVDMAPIYHQNEIIGAVSVCKSVSEVYLLANELKQSKKRVSQLENTVGRMHQVKYSFTDIIGCNEQLIAVKNLAKKVASTDLNILITGESGTGKELFAQGVHRDSNRSHYPFVPVNCAAIPGALLESELFGYEEGAFTSSKQNGKIGLFELAHRGTIFLDEIGDMSLDLQAKLLRVLQEGTIRKIGSLTEQKIDVRVIAATNKDLANMVHKDRFREDLFYRINTVQMMIPPLRSRKDDIPEIVEYLLGKENNPLNIQINQEALTILQKYDWPGNIRELKNAIQYAISVTDKLTITIVDFPETIKKLSMNKRDQITPIQSLEAILSKTEKQAIIETLNRTGTSVKGKKAAAKLLGISLASLYNKIAKLHVEM